MIAVFSNSAIHFNFAPRRKFKVIRNIFDLRGVRFDAVMDFGGWERDRRKSEAYEALRGFQPELFKND